MGCFLGCFGSSKDKKHRKQRRYGSPRLQNIGGQTLVQTTETPVLSIPEKVAYSVLEPSGEKYEEQLSSSTRKKVTFDSNVQTYEHVTVYESTDLLLDKNDASDKEVEEEKVHLARSNQSRTSSEDDSTISSVGSYPQNHRYQNCRDSDDEVVESEYEESDLDDEEEEDEYDGDDDYGDEINDGSMLCQEVWSETIPLESKESRTGVSLKRVGSEEVDSPMPCVLPEQEVKTVVLNRNARDRSVYVHPVLNPVENLSQWKAVKSKGTSVLKPNQKENSVADGEAPHISFGLEPSFKQSSYSPKPQSNHPMKNQNKEMAVDASLSNWLVAPEITPERKSSPTKFQSMTSKKSMSQGSNSVMSIEDRPILGALTLEELNQYSATSSSPRKSPSRSPDDMVLMGTVGTYWKHTGEARNSGSSSYKGIPNTTSKYREDKKVNWHSTPFETRLERALNRGSAEA